VIPVRKNQRAEKEKIHTHTFTALCLSCPLSAHFLCILYSFIYLFFFLSEGLCFGSHPGFRGLRISVPELFQPPKYRLPVPFLRLPPQIRLQGNRFARDRAPKRSIPFTIKVFWFEGWLLRVVSSIGVSLRLRGFRRYLIWQNTAGVLRNFREVTVL